MHFKLFLLETSDLHSFKAPWEMWRLNDNALCVQVIESTQELGNDLAGVMALQRKLTGMERDLAAIEDKLGDLAKEAERLAAEHPEQSEAIKGRLAEITAVWDEMKVDAAQTNGVKFLERHHCSPHSPALLSASPCRRL